MTTAAAEPAAPVPNAKALQAAQVSEGLRPVYVWQAPVRATHWLIVLSMSFLVATGLYIGNPFLIVSGRASEHFVMGWMRAVHFYAAIVFTLSVLTRLWWMLVGNQYAKWHQLLPVAAERRHGVLETLKFYLMLKPRPPEFAGHNPLAGATYSVVFFLYLVMIASGLGLYAMNAHVASPMRGFEFFLAWFGGAQSARYIHHIVMWLLLGFVAHHVWSAFLVSTVERNGTMDSIFTGFKFLRRRESAGPKGSTGE